MSLLTLMQDTFNILGLSEPSSVLNNTDSSVKQALAMLYDVGQETRDRFAWPELNKEHTITLVASQQGYALPDDYDRQVFETHWAQSEQWPLIGPITPQEWRARQDGIITSSPRQRFRVRGYDGSEILIDPTPDSDDAGNTLIFEYQSTEWFQPPQWVTSTSYSASDYVSNIGNVYQTAAGGTSGATAPTHTTGDASDGTVTWTFVSDEYVTFNSDNDIFIIDERLLGHGLKWRFMEQKGLPFGHYRELYEAQIRRHISHLRGAKTLNLAQRSATRLLSAENVPDTGYGS